MVSETLDTQEKLKEIEFIAVNGFDSELKVIEQYKKMLAKYRVPLLTSKIHVEAECIPHSHPVLTLNAREAREESLFETFVHEQLHWFFDENEERRARFLDVAKPKYEDLGDCNTQRNPNSPWEHIVVTWNTVNTLRQQLDEQAVRWVFGGPHRPYPLTEKRVFEEYDDIARMLVETNMVFDISKLR